MEDSQALIFFNSWLWAIFVAGGLLMVLLELIIGVETGFDLVVIGSLLIISGLVTSFIDIWWITAVCASILCLIYVVAGRRYVHKLRQWRTEIKTNIDAIIGETGYVIKAITINTDGSVKVRGQLWRARAQENINNGEEIVVNDIVGTTLIVKKKEEV